MKLLLCKSCQDVVKFQSTDRVCQCGLSGGRYLDDDVTVEYYGEHAVVLGIDNHTLRAAIVDETIEVSRMITAWVEEGGEDGQQGFVAWRIPESSDRIRRKPDENKNK